MSEKGGDTVKCFVIPLHYTFVSWEIWVRLASGITIQAVAPCSGVILSARSDVCTFRCVS